MITIPAPKNEPAYTPTDRSILRAMFEEARDLLIKGRRSYICHALDVAIGNSEGNTKAHELVLRRLGIGPNGRAHTYRSWFVAVNAGLYPIAGTGLRIKWLDALIKEFE